MNRPDYTVANLGELVTLATTDLAEGANVWVDADGAYWTLEKDSGALVSGTVLQPLPGAPQSGASNARWLRNVGGGGGGGVTGDPNSIVFENPTGSAAITDPNFVAAPLDPQGRPMIRDKRVSPINGRGSIWRQGSWPIDGDPGPGVKGEGFVSIGANSLNNGPDSSNGAFFLATPGSFGIAQIIAGVNGGSCFYPCGFEDASVDNPAFCGPNLFVMNDDTARTTFQVDRMRGNVALTGNIVQKDPGQEIQIKEGANAMQGLATTAPGGPPSVLVLNNLITANTRVSLTWQADGGNVPLGTPMIVLRTPGVSFTISSTNPADNGCDVFWQLWEPAP